MFNYTRLDDIRIDKCYLDNTYFNTIYNSIPSRVNATNALISLIDLKRSDISNAVFAIKMNNIGKEELLVDLCKAFDTKVAVSSERLQRYSSYLCDDDLEYFTLKLKQNTLFYVKDDEKCFSRNFRYRYKFLIRPTAMVYKNGSEYHLKTSLSNLVNYYSDSNLRTFQIPYSDHGSYKEIINFIRLLKPVDIEFNNKIPELTDMSKLERYLTASHSS